MPIAMHLAARNLGVHVLDVALLGNQLSDQCVEPRLTTGARVGARRCGDRSALGRTPNVSAGRSPPAGYA